MDLEFSNRGIELDLLDAEGRPIGQTGQAERLQSLQTSARRWAYADASFRALGVCMGAVTIAMGVLQIVHASEVHSKLNSTIDEMERKLKRYYDSLQKQFA